MKIALVSQEYPPETGHGGIASQTFLKANGLVARGHDVTVISHSIDGHRSEEDRLGVRVIRVPGPDGRLAINSEAVRWLAYSHLVAEELARLDARVELDLIDVPDWASEGYVHLLNRAPDATAPTVVHLHGPLVMFTKAIGWPAEGSQLQRIGSHMESTCIGAADAVFSSSGCSADWCADSYGIDRADIEIVHLGVDRKLFAPRKVPKESRATVAFVGKMVRNKGVETLVDAALSVVRSIPDLHVWLIGPDPEGLAASLEVRVSEAGNPDLIRSFGYRAAEELPELLSRAHLLAAPSFYEGGPGFTVLEAMACGLPVVASDGSGLTEVVRHGDNGLLVPPMDTSGLAGAIEQLLLDPSLREKMSDRALRTVESEADTDRCVARLEALYERVVGERRADR